MLENLYCTSERAIINMHIEEHGRYACIMLSSKNKIAIPGLGDFAKQPTLIGQWPLSLTQTAIISLLASCAGFGFSASFLLTFLSLMLGCLSAIPEFPFMLG